MRPTLSEKNTNFSKILSFGIKRAKSEQDAAI